LYLLEPCDLFQPLTSMRFVGLSATNSRSA
jgi:hypothetical protein